FLRRGCSAPPSEKWYEKSSPGGPRRAAPANCCSRFFCVCSLWTPNGLQMRHAGGRFLGIQRGAQFKHFEMLRLNDGLERGEIDHACARLPTIAPGELDVVTAAYVEP